MEHHVVVALSAWRIIKTALISDNQGDSLLFYRKSTKEGDDWKNELQLYKTGSVHCVYTEQTTQTPR